MPTRRLLLAAAPVLLSACATLSGREPPRVAVAGLEPLPGQGLELRFLVKLRVQNPNDAPLDYHGLFLELDLRGLPFASGVSDAAGSVPRYGETVISLPVTVSALAAARQLLELAGGSAAQTMDYALRGRLAGPVFGSLRFESSGELAWPARVIA